MCKICEQIKQFKKVIRSFDVKDVELGYGYYCGLRIRIRKNDIRLRAEGEGWYESEPIKYCMFCGRKL